MERSSLVPTANDYVVCECCECEWHTSQLDTSGPVKEWDEDRQEFVKRWFYVCPGCYSDRLQIVVKIEVPICT